MQFSFLLCVVLYSGCAIAGPAPESLYPRGCIYINGRCHKECEVGTHAYTTGCGPLLPEATCDNPNPKIDPKSGSLCDFSACYCDAPTVRSKTGHCIPVSECVNEPKTQAPAENVAAIQLLEPESDGSQKVLEIPTEVGNVQEQTEKATGVLHPRGCIYIDGQCASECEVGTHAYSTGCGPLTPEATCKDPNPKADPRSIICDYSACYCDAPTVRSASGACVSMSQCNETTQTEKKTTPTKSDEKPKDGTEKKDEMKSVERTGSEIKHELP